MSINKWNKPNKVISVEREIEDNAVEPTDTVDKTTCIDIEDLENRPDHQKSFSGADDLNKNNNTNRKSRKRKRSYQQHNNKGNKKWSKQYKWQQNQHNNNKSDVSDVGGPGGQMAGKNSNSRKYSHGQKSLRSFIKFVSHRNRGLSKFFLPDKRPRKELIIPPTKFLLGGNISDPLNLNSLQDEALNASMNAATPKSSPITTPPKIEVIIPPNISDPLHLMDPVDSVEYEKQLISPLKRRLKHRNRKHRKARKRNDSNVNIVTTTTVIATGGMISENDNDHLVNTEDDEEKLPAASIVEQKSDSEDHVQLTTDQKNEPVDGVAFAVINTSSTSKDSVALGMREKCVKDLRLDLNIDGAVGGRKRKISESLCSNKVKLRRMDSMDKIVSPVIPQPGAWKRPPMQIMPMGAPRNRHRTISLSTSEEFPNDMTSGDREKIDDVNRTQEHQKQQQQVEDHQLVEIVTSTTSAIDENDDNNKIDEQKMPIFKKENAKYQYGNYSRYFGFNSLNDFMDVRLIIFKRHSFLFKDKDILDIGCNAGYMTIAIAKKLHPKTIIGIDIDKSLILKAKRNLSMYVRMPSFREDGKCDNTTDKLVDEHQIDVSQSVPQNGSNIMVQSDKKRSKLQKRAGGNGDKQKIDYFPISFPVCYRGMPTILLSHPLVSTATSGEHSGGEYQSTTNVANHDVNKEQNIFPNNVFFRTINYVLSDESQLNADTQQYDLILCLSTTKWIHLNFGDAGLKIAFKRMFNQLRPGGKLILEAQNWASYKKKKKLTETIYNNYKNIEFFPNKFHEYLLGPEVGFSHSYPLGIPRHLSKGFRRPIQLYVKGDFTPSQIQWSDSYHPQTPYEPYRGYYATTAQRSRRNRSSGWCAQEATPYISSGRYMGLFTPLQGLLSTSQYYNPLETDSYLPSYDTEIQHRHYCFASPLYSTVWSPPSGRRSASQTPLFGSIRRINDADESSTGKRHVYWPSSSGSGGRESSRSIDESSRSPQTRHVYATVSSCSNSVREQDVDNNNSPKEHVYVTSGDVLSSPVQHYSGESSRSVEIEPDENGYDSNTEKKEVDQ